MFTVDHFLWLAICIIYILSLVFLQSKYKLNIIKLLNIFLVICFLSESIKIFDGIIFYNADKEVTTNIGEIAYAYLDKNKLPFHLCTLHIFLAIIARLTQSEKTRSVILNIIAPTGIIGATIPLFVLIYTPCFNQIVLYEYFLYHASLIAFGIILIKDGYCQMNFKNFGRTMIFLIAMLFLSLYVNSILGIDSEANFMYTSYPPVEGLPIINLENGWFVYIISFAAIAVITMGCLYLPFIITRYIKNKNNKLVGKQ